MNVKSFAASIKVPLAYIFSELSVALRCCSINLCHACGKENKQEGRLKDALMTKLHDNSYSTSSVAQG